MSRIEQSGRMSLRRTKPPIKGGSEPEEEEEEEVGNKWSTMVELFLRHSGTRNTTVPINCSVTVGYVVRANYTSCMKTCSQSKQTDVTEHVFPVRAN